MTEVVNDNAPKEDAVRATSGSAPSGDKDPAQKDTSSDTKTTSSSRYNTDIYGRVPGKEPKYPIPCPSK